VAEARKRFPKEAIAAEEAAAKTAEQEENKLVTRFRYLNNLQAETNALLTAVNARLKVQAVAEQAEQQAQAIADQAAKQAQEAADRARQLVYGTSSKK